MQATNFEEVLEKILNKDPRYNRDAYFFVREALDFTQKRAAKGKGQELRHVSGQELLIGIRDHSLEQFGPMAATVFDEWGIRSCEDFGEIVFNMVEHGFLAKTDNDSRSDFKGGYNFYETFRLPFLPRAKRTVAVEQPVPPTDSSPRQT
jgi:uncharacterized repeat protein (TIGR04138 family)